MCSKHDTRLSSFVWLIYLACIATSSLLLLSCSQPKSEDKTKFPVFVQQPEFELDPHLSAPLAGLLTLNTDITTRIDVEIIGGDNSKTIRFDEFKKNHKLIIVGFKPDKTFQLEITAISENGQKTRHPQLLEVTTDPLPDGFPIIELKHSDYSKMEPGYNLFDIIPEGDNAEFGSLIVIVDNTGDVLWYQVGTRYTDVRTRVNGNILFIEGEKIVEMDLLGRRIFEWTGIVDPNKTLPEKRIVNVKGFHHEVFPMQNGNLLTLSVESRVFDNYRTSLKDSNAPRETANVVGDIILELEHDGSIVHTWHVLDMLDPYRHGWESLNTYWDQMFNKKTRDWSHGNSVIHVPEDDTIIYTSRHQEATIKFSRKTGKLIWILAPHDNWDMDRFGKYLLKPTKNRKNFFPYHSHSPMVLANGNLLLYDNGNYRTPPFGPWIKDKDNFSRAVEYAINEQTKEIELVWEYGEFVNEKDRIYSGALGDADKLPTTGNILITHGTIFDFKTEKYSTRIIEVTHTTPAEEVFQLDIYDPNPDNKNGWRVYRTERVPPLYW